MPFVKVNKVTEIEIYNYLIECDNLFLPALSDGVNIKEYSKKIRDNATTFEAYDDNVFVGLVAAYFNKKESFVFITSVSVKEKYQNQGIVFRLLHQCILKAEIEDYGEIGLHVHKDNYKALAIYIKFGFEVVEKYDNFLFMTRKIND